MAVVLLCMGCGSVQTTAHDPVGVGSLRPVQEDHDAGLVGIAPGFELSGYHLIAVDRVTAPYGETKDEDDRQLASAMSSFFHSELVRRLRASGLFDRVVDLSEGGFEPGTSKALKLVPVITQLTGGSRALRFWIGFGAGRSKAQAEMRFFDFQSGQPVMVTGDRRVAAMSEAMSLDYGGDSEGLLKQSFDNMARDLAKFLVRLSRREAPQP